MNPMLILLCFALLLGEGTASSPNPTSYVVQGWNTECFFLMRSTIRNGELLGVGDCYKIKADGTFQRLWQFEGDYSYEGRIFLGGEGRVLVRIVEMFQAQPGRQNLEMSDQNVLEFYREGKILTKISVRDVVDPAKLKLNTVGLFSTHRIFNYNDTLAPKMGRLPYFDFFNDDDREVIRETVTDETEIFCITTVQAELLVFKVADGSLIYRKKLKSSPLPR